MRNAKLEKGRDEVLAEYAEAAESFNAAILLDFVQRYPKHADALNRFAQVQLSSVRATPSEIGEVEVDPQQMLAMQSKLLQRLHEQRAASGSSMTPASAASSSDAEIRAASLRIAEIRGNKRIEEASVAVFGAVGCGQDDALMILLEPPGIRDAPAWAYSCLATHLGISSTSLWASLQSQFFSAQRFSAHGKPTEAQPISWEEALQQAITDDSVRAAILKKT